MSQTMGAVMSLSVVQADDEVLESQETLPDEVIAAVLSQGIE